MQQIHFFKPSSGITLLELDEIKLFIHVSYVCFFVTLKASWLQQDLWMECLFTIKETNKQMLYLTSQCYWIRGTILIPEWMFEMRLVSENVQMLLPKLNFVDCQIISACDIWQSKKQICMFFVFVFLCSENIKARFVRILQIIPFFPTKYGYIFCIGCKYFKDNKDVAKNSRKLAI